MGSLERDAAVVDLWRRYNMPWRRGGRDREVAVSKQQHDPSSGHGQSVRHSRKIFTAGKLAFVLWAKQRVQERPER
jgi:hypothetical protein